MTVHLLPLDEKFPCKKVKEFQVFRLHRLATKVFCTAYESLTKSDCQNRFTVTRASRGWSGSRSHWANPRRLRGDVAGNEGRILSSWLNGFSSFVVFTSSQNILFGLTTFPHHHNFLILFNEFVSRVIQIFQRLRCVRTSLSISARWSLIASKLVFDWIVVANVPGS